MAMHEPLAEQLQVRLENIALEQCDRGCMHCGLCATPKLQKLSFRQIKAAIEMFPTGNIGAKSINGNSLNLFFNTGEALFWSDARAYIGDAIMAAYEKNHGIRFKIYTSGTDRHSEQERRALESIAKLDNEIKKQITFVLSINPFPVMKNPYELQAAMLEFLLNNRIKFSTNICGKIDLQAFENEVNALLPKPPYSYSEKLHELFSSIIAVNGKNTPGNAGNWGILHDTYGPQSHYYTHSCLKDAGKNTVNVMLVALENGAAGYAVSCCTWISPFLLLHEPDAPPQSYDELVEATAAAKRKVQEALSVHNAKFIDNGKICQVCAGNTHHRDPRRLAMVAGEQFVRTARRFKI